MLKLFLRKRRKDKKSEKGFMLLQAVVAMMLGAGATTFMMQQNMEEQGDIQAAIAGQMVHQYTAAVAEYQSAYASPTSAVPLVNGFNPVGVNWLRTAATCGAGNGTGLIDFLPCTFPTTFSFGLTPNTLFTDLGGGKWQGDTTFGRILFGANLRMDLTEEVKRSAQNLGHGVSQASAAAPMTSTIFNSYIIDYTLGATEGTIHSVVDNNASTDAWLRTDGSNQMNANANIGNNSIYNMHSIAVGDNQVASLNNGQIDAVGDINGQSNLNISGNANVTGDATITGITQTNRAYVTNSSGTYANGLQLGGNELIAGAKITTNTVGDQIQDAQAGRTIYEGFYSRGRKVLMTGASSHEVYGDGWALYTGNNATVSNVAALSATGSANVNDIYLRSKGVWLSDMVSRMPTTAIVATQLAIHNQIISKPACPVGGTPKIFIIPMTWEQKTSPAINWYAVDFGTFWRVYSYTFNPFPSGTSAATGMARAITQLACRY